MRRRAAGSSSARRAAQRPHTGHRHAAEQLRGAGGLGAPRAAQRADHRLLPPLPEGSGYVCWKGEPRRPSQGPHGDVLRAGTS